MVCLNIQPETWYPHQSWLNILRDIHDGPDGETNLVTFGKQVVQNAVLPPALDSIPKVLHALHANLRNIPEEEGYRIKELGEGHYYVCQNTPNPDTAIYGFIWGCWRASAKRRRISRSICWRTPTQKMNPV